MLQIFKDVKIVIIKNVKTVIFSMFEHFSLFSFAVTDKIL